MSDSNISETIGYATLLKEVQENPGHGVYWYNQRLRITTSQEYLDLAVKRAALRKVRNLPALGGWVYYPA